MKSILVCAGALSMAALVSPALAKTPTVAEQQALDGLTALRQLDLIVTGSVTGGGIDTEGKAFIGGNSSGGTFNNADSHGAFQASSYPTLTVGGNVSGNVNIDSYNSQAPGFLGAKIGGSGGTYSINGSNSQLYVGGTVGNYNANGQTFQQNVSGLQQNIQSQTTAFISDLSSLSKALGALKATPGSSYNKINQNNALFTAVDGGKGYAVIDITNGQSAFNNAGQFNYNIPTVSGGGYLPTIVNISGSSSYTINANPSTSKYDGYVLFNFVDATSVTLNTQLDASILAPLASIRNNTQINGSVAAKSFNQGGEVHLGTFLGGGTSNGGITDPARGLEATLATPEPASWAMMIVGFGLAGAALRRRRVAVAA